MPIFSQHYLDAILEDDLRLVLEGWQAAEKAGAGKPPDRRVAALAERFFRTTAQLSERAR